MEDIRVSENASRYGEEESNQTGVGKRSRKVKFSRPLEYWKEFDKETGNISELKDSRVKENLALQSKKRTDTSRQNNDPKGRTKSQSIAKVVEAFQKRQNEKLNVLKQSEEKEKDCISGCKQNVKLSVFTPGSVHIKKPDKNRKPHSVVNCPKLTTDGALLCNFQKESSRIQNYCTYSFSTSLRMLTGFKERPFLPIVCSSRKLYDDRLLPNTPAENCMSGNYQTAGKALPHVVKKLTTPYIVQLFE